jgi:hypothetical protein
MPKPSLSHVNIIEMLGIQSLPIEKRQEIVMSALELVETRTLNRVLAVLDQTSREGFERLLHDPEDTDKIATFLRTHGIDYWKITEEEIEKVKQELLESAEEDN